MVWFAHWHGSNTGLISRIDLLRMALNVPCKYVHNCTIHLLWCSSIHLKAIFYTQKNCSSFYSFEGSLVLPLQTPFLSFKVHTTIKVCSVQTFGTRWNTKCALYIIILSEQMEWEKVSKYKVGAVHCFIYFLPNDRKVESNLNLKKQNTYIISAEFVISDLILQWLPKQWVIQHFIHSR